MGKRKSFGKSPESNSKDKIVSKTLVSKPLNKLETPKQIKSVPDFQSERKQDLKKIRKRRVSLPADLVNGGTNDSPTKKQKTEPFTGTADLFIQTAEKNSPSQHKNMQGIKLKDSPDVPQQKGKFKKLNIAGSDSIKSNAETLTDRAKRKKEKVKKIRLAAKDRFKQTISDVTSGDEAAIARLQNKIAELQKKEKLSYSGKRKLRKLKRILQNSNIAISSTSEQIPVQQNVKQQQNKTANVIRKTELQKSTPLQRESGKNTAQNKNQTNLKKNNAQNNKQKSEQKKPLVQVQTEDSDDEELEDSDDEELEDNDDDANESKIPDESSSADENEDIEEEGSEGGSEEVEKEDEIDSEAETEEVEKSDESAEMSNNSSNEESDDEDETTNKTVPPISQPSNKFKRQLSDTPTTPQKGQSRYVVFVGNLPYDITKQEISEHFSKINGVKYIRIPLDKTTNKCRGFAYVEVPDQTSYEKALSLHHTFIKGRRINVLYTQGGKKQGEEKKKEIKAKNFKLNAMRQEGKLAGAVKSSQKRSFRRTKQWNANKKE